MIIGKNKRNYKRFSMKFASFVKFHILQQKDNPFFLKNNCPFNSNLADDVAPS